MDHREVPPQNLTNFHNRKKKKANLKPPKMAIWTLRVCICCFWTHLLESPGFPGYTRGKAPTWQQRRCKRHRFNPWVTKVPCRRAGQPTAVFLPWESHGQRRLVCYTIHEVAKNQTQLKWLSTHAHTPVTTVCYTLVQVCGAQEKTKKQGSLCG